MLDKLSLYIYCKFGFEQLSIYLYPKELSSKLACFHAAGWIKPQLLYPKLTHVKYGKLTQNFSNYTFISFI
jgi:hypothetical protein